MVTFPLASAALQLPPSTLSTETSFTTSPTLKGLTFSSLGGVPPFAPPPPPLPLPLPLPPFARTVAGRRSPRETPVHAAARRSRRIRIFMSFSGAGRSRFPGHPVQRSGLRLLQDAPRGSGETVEGENTTGGGPPGFPATGEAGEGGGRGADGQRGAPREDPPPRTPAQPPERGRAPRREEARGPEREEGRPLRRASEEVADERLRRPVPDEGGEALPAAREEDRRDRGRRGGSGREQRRGDPEGPPQPPGLRRALGLQREARHEERPRGEERKEVVAPLRASGGEEEEHRREPRDGHEEGLLPPPPRAPEAARRRRRDEERPGEGDGEEPRQVEERPGGVDLALAEGQPPVLL